MKENHVPISIFVVEHRGDGGMIHYAYQMCTSLSNLGAKVTLVTSKDYELINLPHNFTIKKLLRLWPTAKKNSTESISDLSPSHVTNYLSKLYRKVRRIFRGMRYIFEWFRLYRYLIDQKPDIIQFGKIEFEFEGIFLHLLKAHNLILTQICHEFEAREKTRTSAINNFLRKRYMNLYDNFSIIFFHAENNLNHFQTIFDVPNDKLKIIHHGNEDLFTQFGIDSVIQEKFIKKYRITKDVPLILFFGVLAPSKGLPDLIKAFSLVLKNNNQPKLVIAGSPSKHINMQELYNLVESLDISPSVYIDARYIPNHEVGALMSLARVVVYPYISSTQSGSLQVAYSFGKPVIATAVGGLPEVVEHNKSGYLVPSQDPQSLSLAILNFVKDPVMAKTMGDYAKHLSETIFSWDGIATTILNYYQGL